MQLNIDKELAICDELHRLVELNDASLDGEIAAAQELFDDSAAAHYEALLRRFKEVCDFVFEVHGSDILHAFGPLTFDRDEKIRLAELLDLPDSATHGLLDLPSTK